MSTVEPYFDREAHPTGEAYSDLPDHPIQFDVEYPDRPLGRISTLLRPLIAVPIILVLNFLSADFSPLSWPDDWWTIPSGLGVLTACPVALIIFRRKYPRWWFDWNLEYLRFTNRILVYLALMDDRYPSTDEQQSVSLEAPYPNVRSDLNPWIQVFKFVLIAPHYLALAVLWAGALVAIVIAWVWILVTQRYPRSLFTFVEGVLRWQNRVLCYAALVVTDAYPPFRLSR